MVKVFFKQAIKKAARVILPLMYWNRVNFEAFTSLSLNHFGVSSFFLSPSFHGASGSMEEWVIQPNYC